MCVAQKSKTLVVVAVGGIVPVTVGNTRVPRIVVPASTPVDAFGAFSHLAVCAKTFARKYNLLARSKG